jgi:hypothetical protein
MKKYLLRVLDAFAGTMVLVSCYAIISKPPVEVGISTYAWMFLAASVVSLSGALLAAAMIRTRPVVMVVLSQVIAFLVIQGLSRM